LKSFRCRYDRFPKSVISFYFFAAVLFISCGREPAKKDYVAKVNDTYLTREELSGMIDTTSNNKFFKDEVIRNWINKELLYQEAERNGILDEDEFNSVINNSKKELAAALLLDEYYENEKIEYEPDDIEEFFGGHKDDFRLIYDSYLINKIIFNDEDKAVQYRYEAITNGWDNALSSFVNNPSIIKYQGNLFLHDYEIYPVTLLRIVQELFPNEISIVIHDKNDNFLLVELLKKFDKGTIPNFDVIKEKVEKRFILEKKEILIRNYIKELYSKNDIEIKQR